ncbi:MAG: thioredoxin family protein [Anaerolineae bacterium]
MNAPHAPTNRTHTFRVVGASLIALAVIAVLTVKAFAARDTPVPDPVQIPATTTAIAEPPSTLSQEAAVADATLSPQSGTDQDPFPASPEAQVEWVLRQQRPALVLFHSTNCIPCKTMEALVASVRGDYEPQVVFIDVITNDRANLELVQQAGIQAIPTTFFINSAGEGQRYVGAFKAEILRAELDKLLVVE